MTTQTSKEGLMGTTKTRTKALAAGLLVAGMMATSLLAAQPVHAATAFTVNLKDDRADVNPGDGTCSVVDFGAFCSLRAAIEEANATPGADTINFGIGASGGAVSISPASPLPAITEQVTIDGYTQPGAKKNTLTKGTDAQLKIELNGDGADSASGLAVEAPNSVIRGLAINRFEFDGIRVDLGASGTRIEGNFIGTNATGLARFDNSNGVSIGFSPNNTVGGTTPEARNLISGNTEEGVNIFNASSTGNKVLGNLIGTKPDGISPLTNNGSGVSISGASNNFVGNGSSGGSNTIAFNLEDGVDADNIGANLNDANGNRILRNSIFSNREQGIDLGADGPTANDAGDADLGANGLQNSPALTSANFAGGKTTIKGKLSSTASKTFTLQFFSNPSGADEGQKFIGEKSVTTDGSGKASFTFEPAGKVKAGQVVTATATDGSGNTSELSAPVKVGAKKK